ncbi:MAG: NUDIX hydrolase [Caldilineaceae bacterium]|nr:NUDIX hydrolase [Caldilineaceae bacterium]
MSEAQSAAKPERAKMATLDQVSAGGVAFRYAGGSHTADSIEVALISVGNPARWQLPKGIVDPGETPEVTALREVREEAGIEATLIAPLNPVEYWYVGHRGKQRVRFHKLVHFFLMDYVRGDVSDHDREVNEARWVSLEQAQAMLAFKGERQAVAQAASLQASGTISKDEV